MHLDSTAQFNRVLSSILCPRQRTQNFLFFVFLHARVSNIFSLIKLVQISCDKDSIFSREISLGCLNGLRQLACTTTMDYRLVMRSLTVMRSEQSIAYMTIGPRYIPAIVGRTVRIRQQHIVPYHELGYF